MTEEEAKEKLDKEIDQLAKKGDKVKAETQIKDAKKSLAKVLEDEKISGDL